MRSWIKALIFVLMPGLVAAQDSGLKSLDTMDAGRNFTGVGRLDLNGSGFCTGALIAPDLVLTAAHCLFNKQSGGRINLDGVEFLAGWRLGRASAYRGIRRAVIHPDYDFADAGSAARMRNDIALLELDRPIRNTTVIPFETGPRPRRGKSVGVVSYAKNRSEAPSLQRVCSVMARQQGVLVVSCDVDFGSSGAPIFDLDGDTPRIVSVVSAKAEVEGDRVALGAALDESLLMLRAELASSHTLAAPSGDTGSRIRLQGSASSGAKFVRP